MIRGSWLNRVLVVFSAIFYIWISPGVAAVIALSMAVDYCLVRLMKPAGGAGNRRLMLLKQAGNFFIYR